MIIYYDLLFFLNVFLDFILLMGVSVILTRNASIKRIILGSILGGGTTFLLFFNINSILLIILKMLFGFFMVIITFHFNSFKYTLNNVFYLYCISFSIGGVLYLFINRGIYNYFILIIGFIIVVFLYIKQMKKLGNNYNNYYKVLIYYHNKKISCTGFLDTGNKLCDIYHNRPVILIDKKIRYHDNEIIYVPYCSLNNEGVLKCIKVDKIIINNHIFKNYLVGFSNNKIQIDGIDCILHSKMKGELNA